MKGQHVPCRFCGGADGDGHLFWDCTFLPLVEIREHPEFHDRMEKSCWPPGAFYGMVGYLYSRGWMVVLLGRSALLKALVTC